MVAGIFTTLSRSRQAAGNTLFSSDSTDYLEGDVYFKTERTGQNLERCRAQFALVQAMETAEGEMLAIVEGVQETGPDSTFLQA